MNPPLIAPSILSADFTRLGSEISEVVAAGADWLHVDVMDGHFVPNISFGPVIAEAARRCTTIPVDVHLMIEAPDRYLESFAAAGASSLTVHVEACPRLAQTLARIRDLGLRAGVALNPGTPLEALDESLDLADLVLVMTVNPGFGGQPFLPDGFERVERVRRALDARGIDPYLEVDGGVDVSNAADLVRAGANILVAGSAIFRGADGIAVNMSRLRASLASREVDHAGRNE